MGEDVEDVAGGGVDDRKSVDLVLDEDADGVEERGVGVDPDQVLHIWQRICESETTQINWYIENSHNAPKEIEKN